MTRGVLRGQGNRMSALFFEQHASAMNFYRLKTCYFQLIYFKSRTFNKLLMLKKSFAN